MGKNIDKLLLELYENPRSNVSFSGEKKLFKAAKKLNSNVTIKDIKTFLRNQESYTLYKLTKKKYPTQKILAPKPLTIVSLDLADLSKISKYNKNIKFLMFFIDLFSKKISVIPIKNKSKTSILNGLIKFFSLENNHLYSRIYSDKEGALWSTIVKKYLDRNKKILYSNTSRERKNAPAEIGIRILKNKIYKYMTHYKTNKYIDKLSDIVYSINNSNNRSLKNKHLTPNILHNIKNVNFINNQFQRMFDINTMKKSQQKHSFKVGQTVRIPNLERTQNIFFKAFYPSNTFEIFKIDSIDKRRKPYLYRLVDVSPNRNRIYGSFYGEELTRANLKSIYPIKILKKQKFNGIVYAYVTYLDWPAHFNEWLPLKNISDYEK